MEIIDLQKKHGITLHCIEHNLLLHALASCLKRKNAMRKQQALEMAQAVWGKPLPSTVYDFNCGLSSALQLCLRVGTKEARLWADELWAWSEQQAHVKSAVTFTCMMALCEVQGRHDAVNDLLRQFKREGHELNAVVLGSLLEQAAYLFDSRRADEIWSIMVIQQHVEPNFLTYTTYAKAQLLEGKPERAVEIVDHMLLLKQGDLDYKLLVDYLQALLIVCHSCMSIERLKHLEAFLRQGGAIVRALSAKSGKENWRRLEAKAKELISGAKELRFSDLIVTYTARSSVMKGWEDHPPGSHYLPNEKPSG